MATYTFLTNKDKDELEEKIDKAAESGTVSDEQIEAAVEDYLTENPPEGGTVTDEQVATAVEEYMTENPVETPEVDLSNYYTKTEVDTAIDNVDTDVDLSNYYTKTEVDTAITNNTVSDEQIETAVEDYLTVNPPVQDSDIATAVDTYMTNNPIEVPESDFEIYVGSGDMPDGHVMQIEPDSDDIELTDIEIVGIPVLGKIDSSNNVVLSGSLDVGTYTVKYELSDGSTVDIGSITIEE